MQCFLILAMFSFFYDVISKVNYIVFIDDWRNFELSKVKILITGGAGFIPSSLADSLINLGYEVVLMDNLVTGRLENIPEDSNCSFYNIDINNIDAIEPVMMENNFDFVFHYASLVGVQRTLDNPIKVLNDIDGLKNVFHLSQLTGVKKIFYSSSSEVYGEPVHLPQNEYTTPLNSKLPYAVVKNIGECFCRSYHQEYGLDYTIFRFFNTYGEKQSADFVVSRFINQALSNEDITINGDGSQTRTFCYINDNLDATINALQNNIYNNDVVNIGNDNEITIIQLAEKIKDIIGSKSRIIHRDPSEEGDMTRRQPDVSRMKKLLNRDFIELSDGLNTVINSFKQ